MDRKPGAHHPIFGHYRLLSLIGVGGYARVYRAEERDGARRTVAIKVARDCGEGKSRKVVRALSNEARIMSRLDHPNLVSVHEFGQVDGRYFIAMELVNGLSLKEMAKRCRRRGIFFGPAAAAEVVRKIAAGLQAAHTLTDEQGAVRPVIHRDLKPANVMVTRAGEVKVMDFGVAKWPLAEVSTTAGIIKGTPLYMAPEQVRALPVTPASDVFSLGTVLYQLLTNRPLFQADSIKILLRRVARAEVDEQLEHIPEDSLALVPVLRQALHRNPSERVGSAQVFMELLDEALTRVDDDGDLATLARATFGGRPPAETPVAPDENPTEQVQQPARPAYSEKATGMNWSVRMKGVKKGVMIEYDRKKSFDEDL